MFQLFKDCSNLLEVDLSGLDGANLINLNSAFENCNNLEFANLTLSNGDKVKSMDNSFNGCQKLKNIDLTRFEPKQNVSLVNMFKNCASLIYVDLSSFHSYNFRGIFNGCINIVININIVQNTTTDLNEIINKTEEIKLECEIGEDQKCKECMEGKNSQYCADCNEGYYVPYKKKRTECIKCEDNCLECFVLVTFCFCYICKEGYEPINGKCEKPVVKTGEIPNCIIGESEKCKSFDSNQPEFCDSCNEGYYLSEYDKTKCKKCSLVNCKICPNDICTECFDDYNINYKANYPYLTDQEAFEKVYKEMNLHDTSVNKIYYKTSDSKTIAIVIPKKIYFVWNKYNREMIAIYGITLSTDSDLRSINNEYIQ